MLRKTSVLMTFSLSSHYRVFKKSSPNCKVRFPRACYEVEGGLFGGLGGPFPSLSCLSLASPPSFSIRLSWCFSSCLLLQAPFNCLECLLKFFLIILVVCLLPSFRCSFDSFFYQHSVGYHSIISSVICFSWLFPPSCCLFLPYLGPLISSLSLVLYHGKRFACGGCEF